MKQIKLIIAGCRYLNDLTLISRVLKLFEKDIPPNSIKEIVQGGARGVDSLAKKWAENHNVTCKEFQVDWKNIRDDTAILKHNKYGVNARAGFNKNEKMAKYANALLARVQSI